MKRLTIFSIAATLFVAPFAHAQHQPSPHGQQKKVERSVKKNEWKKGGTLSSPGKHSEYRDYRKQGLRAPGKGQRWVRVDGQFLLISAATGAILSVVADR